MRLNVKGVNATRQLSEVEASRQFAVDPDESMPEDEAKKLLKKMIHGKSKEATQHVVTVLTSMNVSFLVGPNEAEH